MIQDEVLTQDRIESHAKSSLFSASSVTRLINIGTQHCPSRILTHIDLYYHAQTFIVPAIHLQYR